MPTISPVIVWHLDVSRIAAQNPETAEGQTILGLFDLVQLGEASQRREAARTLWAKGFYQRVAQFEGSISEAFIATQNLNEPWHCWPCAGLTPEPGIASGRSSSLGDILERDSQMFLATGDGIETIGFLPDSALAA